MFFPRSPTVFRHCLILCALILSESNCQAFLELQESRPLFESLTRAKALSSLQDHLSGPVHAPFHPSSVVNNNLPVDWLLALGVAVYSVAQAWYAVESGDEHPDESTVTAPSSFTKDNSFVGKWASDAYKFELFSDTGHSRQKWLVREVPNTPPNTKSPTGPSQSDSSEATTSGTVASFLGGAFGGCLNQGSGGGDDGDDGDKWPDRTNYAHLLDIHNKDQQMKAFINYLRVAFSKIHSLDEKVNKLTEDMEKLKGGFRTIKGALTTINDAYSRLSVSVAENMPRLPALETRIENLESWVSDSERSSEYNHIAHRNGTLIWKITDFSIKRKEAISGHKKAIHSPSALTSEYGYQFRAKAYLDGDGFGRGTHLSLFFVLTRGEYDALQLWPFQQKVTFMVLDQWGEERHMTDSFSSDPKSSSFMRPRSEMNIASGSPLFMPLHGLEGQNRFVKNDTIFIKIIVE